MKVNKNSWHYKALTGKFLGIEGLYEPHVSNSLCIYFWQVFLMISWRGFFWLLLFPILISFLFVIPLTSLFAWINTGVFLQNAMGLEILAAWLVSGVLTGLGYSIYKVRKWWSKVEYTKSNKESNLIIEYIKTKKRKLCPIIEFTEDK